MEIWRKNIQREMKKEIIVFIITGIFCIILAEIILEVTYPQNKSFIEQNQATKYKGRPHMETTASSEEYTYNIKLNNGGWRDNDFILKKEKKRVLMLGDSMTFGQGVNQDKIFPSLIENTLPEYEIMNLGFPGYGLGMEVRALEEFGKRYNPDKIIIVFYTGNDIEENDDAVEIINNQLLWKNFTKNWKLETKIILSRYSNIYNMIAKVYRGTTTITQPAYTKLLKDKEVMDKALKRTERIIQYLKETNKEDIIVIIMPTKEEISTKAFEQTFKETDVRKEELDTISGVIERILKKENIPYINLKKKGMNNNEELYFNNDIHLTEEGHKKIAEIITNNKEIIR